MSETEALQGSHGQAVLSEVREAEAVAAIAYSSTHGGIRLSSYRYYTRYYRWKQKYLTAESSKDQCR